MRFGLLGPLEVDTGDGGLPIGSPLQRALLAALLLRANRPVSPGVLLAVLWGDDPPPTAVSSLKNHVSKLRQLLGADAGDTADRLRAVPGGYLLKVAEGELDTDEFAALARVAQQARGRGDWAEVSRATSAALALWRGVPLADVPAEALDLDVRHLVEAHRELLEWHFDAALRQGRYDGLAARLSVLVAEYPLVETFQVQYMRVLHQSGRSVEALEVFQRLRRTLVEELGLEPGPEARAVHQAILAADAGPAAEGGGFAVPGVPPAGPPAPAQLPADLADFTGREAEVTRLVELLTMPSGSGSGATPARPLPIAVVAGMGGTGKTTLAVHVAHRVRTAFPDGQLYVDLRGPGSAPRSPEQVLADFLRDLGLAEQSVPVDLAAMAARFRSLTAERRILVVLDNARDAAQVRPLLPGSGSCAVLVTSRNKLPGLDGAGRVDLAGLSGIEARTLLGRIVGPDRTAAEPAATEALLRCCAGLPLAVRIAGARLAGRPNWEVATLAERLVDERRRLDELRVADVAVRTCLEISYAGLAQGAAEGGAPEGAAYPGSPDPARALRLLGLGGGVETALPAAAALLGRPLAEAEESLELLVDACLLDNPVPGRYRMHDLLRVYAAERSVEEPEAERVAAVGRLARWTLLTLVAADALLAPNSRRPEPPVPDPAHPPLVFADRAAALAWCDAEAGGWAEVAAAAAAVGEHGLAWRLAAFGLAYFRLSCRYPEWSAVDAVGLDSARALGDADAQARLLAAESARHLQCGAIEEAEQRILGALELRRAMGDEIGELAQLGNLGLVYERQGRYELARRHHLEVLELARRLGRRTVEANSLNNLATVENHLGLHESALRRLDECRVIWQELGDADGDSVALANQGAIRVQLGDHVRALADLTEALPVTRSFDNRIGEAEIVTNLGSALLGLGRRAEAVEQWRRAVRLWEELDDPRHHEVAALLAEAVGR